MGELIICSGAVCGPFWIIAQAFHGHSSEKQIRQGNIFECEWYYGNREGDKILSLTFMC